VVDLFAGRKSQAAEGLPGCGPGRFLSQPAACIVYATVVGPSSKVSADRHSFSSLSNKDWADDALCAGMAPNQACPIADRDACSGDEHPPKNDEAWNVRAKG